MNTPRLDKSLLRHASSRLGQLQERNDAQVSLTRRDIGSLLLKDPGLARQKAQRCIEISAISDLCELMEQLVGTLLEHFNTLEQGATAPVVVEAAASIIFAGNSPGLADCRELAAVRDLLIQRLGDDFARSAISNRDNHVSPSVVHAMNPPPTSAARLDLYMFDVAKTYSIPWMPEPGRQDLVKILSEILDPASPPIDLLRLRRLCSRGIPDNPPWLRARIWRLFFGTLPVVKSAWARDAGQQRDSYYDLVRRVLKPFSDLSTPTLPPTPLDAALLNVSRQISRIPTHLYAGLQEEPERTGACPLDGNAPEATLILYADILETRLQAIRGPDELVTASAPAIPEIRLESDLPSSPPSGSTPKRKGTLPPITLVGAKSQTADAHPKHVAALRRMLYLHTSINPANTSPHIPALLVPLYRTLSEEIDPEHLCHAEADTFWLFEAMIGEFAELEDEDGGSVWMKKLGERLLWADRELLESLQAKGLDPSLPHYSYRWLAPLLTQTLPIASVIVVWDALFSYPMRERDNSPKLDYLVDICTSMLIRARPALFRLGKSSYRGSSLWSEETNNLPPPSPLRAWEFGDAFMEGMSLLQQFPVEAAGGVDRLLQTASDLAQRRHDEATAAAKFANLSLGERLRTTMWKGFTNQMPSPDVSPPDSEDQQDDSERTDDEDTGQESPAASGIGARFASTVWKGITNQSSMEVPPTPTTPAMPPSPIRSPWPSSKDSPPLERSPDAAPQSSLWNYAEKLKDSDAAAAFAKVSTNWRAKALLSSWRTPQTPNTTQNTPQHSPQMHLSPEIAFVRRTEDSRHASLPNMGNSDYSPPTRPAYFRPPRDSFMGPPGPSSVPGSPPQTPPWSPQSDSGFMSRTRNIQDTFAALTRSKTPEPPSKSGPRPLLLNSSTLLTSTSSHQRRQESISENGGRHADQQWQHVPRGWKRESISQSSASSLSPLDVNGRAGWRKSEVNQLNPDVNIPSRRVALNRRSVSPMAPISRVRPTSGSSSGTSPDRVLSPLVGSGHLRNVSETDSDTTTNAPESRNDITVNKLGLTILSEDTTDSEPLVKPVVSPVLVSPRLRSKRYSSRPANIRTGTDDLKPRSQIEQRSSPQSLSVEWPEQQPEATVTTPKATSFEEVSPVSPGRRKMSGDGQEPRIRKISGGRPRKVSTGTIRAKKRESEAHEGDDEAGYEDLLSAYESEDIQ
ncbi:DUF292-domain-containing protein [Mycena kentingensis (nom. inval.)]|nr:DUF292-domain-containing protein [Mycena kentingensis (nom. inval.)]